MENFREPILIPIPLSRERFRERSYNQTELICEELIRLDTSPRAHQLNLEKNILIKKIDTPHQAQIHDRSHRLKNVVGSFTLKNSDMINGKNIILIDDITTTGATLSEARKVLKKAGAKKIIAFTVAH
jgi:competence protein ComFC